MVWRAAVAGLEAATSVCAALNLAYFLHRAASREPGAVSRRVAALVLVLVSLGALVESVFVLAALPAGPGEGAFASREWGLVRLLAFAGTACVSVLVLRRIGER